MIKKLSAKNLVLFPLVLFFSFLIIFFFIFSDNSALSQNGEGEGEGEEEECIPCCQCCSCFSVGTITGESGCPSCNGECWAVICDPCCGTDCGPPVKVADAYPWEKCQEVCPCTPLCEGGCLEIPKNPRYYDNPNYPTDSCSPEPSKPSGNIYLPVKLDWDDIEGWKDGWCAGSCPRNCVQSYVIKITEDLRNPVTGSGMGEYTAVLDKSEFIPPSCLLKSNRTYQWRVKACCGADGTNCGKESRWSFTTNPAPEPKLPYDPDWIGSGRGENLKKEEIEKLKWCEIDDPLEWEGADGKKYKYYETTLEREKYYCPLTYKTLIYYKKEGGEADLCHPNLKRDGECYDLILVPDEAAGERFPPFEFWDKNHTFFTKLTPYAWKVAACKDISANYCTDYSQVWRFEGEAFILDEPTVVSPPDDKETPIGLPVLISWSSPYAMSWIYEISGIGSGKTSISNVSFDWPQLKLDTRYGWKVKPCWDYETKKCENFWSDTFYFKTTGQPPTLIYPASNATKVPIPVNFEWKSVPGTKSYIFKINGKEKIVEESEITLDYPELRQEISYSWQVKTCAREKEEVCVKDQTCCGDWSNVKSFKTFKLSTPSNPSPGDDETIFTYQMPMNFSWEEVPYARYYKYTINYTFKSPDEVAECPTGVMAEKIVSTPRDFISLNCLGKYEWQVIACLDKNCQETGDPSPLWHFELVQAERPPGPPGGGVFGGLVPCGRFSDDPNTPWNEREPCQIKHIFILIRNIIDFLLWKVAPLLLVLLMVASGVIFYLSLKMEAPAPIAKVKSLWKAAGIGYGILFFGWFIISFILTLFGYRVGIFGPWWKIPF